MPLVPRTTATLHHGDAFKLLAPHAPACALYDLIVCDPPYNQGLAYDNYDDRKSPDEYGRWLDWLLQRCVDNLRPGGAIFVFMPDEWVAHADTALKHLELDRRNWIIWHYTFGVHCKTKFNRSKTHVLYFTKPGGIRTFNVAGVAVPSARAAVYGDKRAAAGGATPHDVWALRPDLEEALYDPTSDTWLVSRVCGTFKERTKHSCQLPEAVLERIIMAASNPGDLILDPVAGTGTTLVVAERLGRRSVGIELSEKSCKLIQKRLKASADSRDPSPESPCGPTSPRARRPKSAASAHAPSATGPTAATSPASGGCRPRATAASPARRSSGSSAPSATPAASANSKPGGRSAS